MTTDIIDRRDRANAAAEELPRQDVWMETNLPWNASFWDNLKPKTLMRLNPHWHIEKQKDAAYPVEDVLVESEFSVTPALYLMVQPSLPTSRRSA